MCVLYRVCGEMYSSRSRTNEGSFSHPLNTYRQLIVDRGVRACVRHSLCDRLFAGDVGGGCEGVRVG